MQAFIQTGRAKFPQDIGGKDDLSIFKLAEVPKPGAPPPGHVTMRVHAAALNPVDFKRAAYFGDVDAAPCIVGYDAAGVVDAVAPDVTRFAVGDRVFGDVVADTLSPRAAYNGALAELVHAPASVLARVPDGVAMGQAAAVPLVATTALQVLREVGLKKGERLFVGAGAGGLGIHLLQIAKRVFGAGEVATTASGAKEAIVREHGADTVVNYRAKDAGEVLAGWGDVVVDTMGDFDTVRKIVKGGTGRLTSIVDSSGDDIVKYLMQPAGKDMELIAAMLADGRLKAVIDSEYALSDSAAAMERQSSGRATGKIIIKIV